MLIPKHLSISFLCWINFSTFYLQEKKLDLKPTSLTPEADFILTSPLSTRKRRSWSKAPNSDRYNKGNYLFQSIAFNHTCNCVVILGGTNLWKILILSSISTIYIRLFKNNGEEEEHHWSPGGDIQSIGSWWWHGYSLQQYVSWRQYGLQDSGRQHCCCYSYWRISHQTGWMYHWLHTQIMQYRLVTLSTFRRNRNIRNSIYKNLNDGNATDLYVMLHIFETCYFILWKVVQRTLMVNPRVH